MRISKIITLLGIAVVLLGAPSASYAQSISATTSDVSEIKVTISGSNIRVLNAAQTSLEIFDIAGVKKASFEIESSDKTVSVNLPKGYYLLRIGKFVRKIQIRE